jgi:agmatine/peptidylarginine deiminase
MKIIYATLFIWIVSLFSKEIFSQEKILPRTMTPEEEAIWPLYIKQLEFNNCNRTNTTPPPYANLRAPGEWEEIEALCITWTSYQSTLRQIVKYAQPQCKVIIICTDSNQVKNYLTSGGVPVTSNIKFINTPFNSVWIRDYGPNGVYTNEVDSLILVDWVYNRPRPQDDVVPTAIANYLNLPIYYTTQSPYKLVHTGGNYQSDGFGKAFSSKLVLNENNTLTVAQIDNIMLDFMGINQYVKMDVLPYDGIHHIDMHFKLLDEETLLVGEYPTGISDGPQIEANLQYVLSNFTSVFGTPFKVFRIAMPKNNTGWPSAGGDYLTYTNSVIINKTVIVPVYTAGNTAQALSVYKQALPKGYNVVGINCDQVIQASGALHCITHEIPSFNPLLIRHQKLQDTYNTTSPYPVSAYIKHRSGIAYATLYYRSDSTAQFDSVPLMPSSNSDYWEGQIPPHPAGSYIQYYIKAVSTNGKVQYRPLVAPQGYFEFNVLNVTSVNNSPLMVNDIYPNPSRGITVIPVESFSEQPLTIEIIDLSGRLVETIFRNQISVGQKNIFVNTQNYPSGLYVIKIATPNHLVCKRLMVK